MNDLTAIFLIIAVGAQAGVILVMWWAITNQEDNIKRLIRVTTYLTNLVEAHENEISQLQSSDKIVRFPFKR